MESAERLDGVSEELNLKRLILAALTIGAIAFGASCWYLARVQSVEQEYSAPLYSQSLPPGFESYGKLASAIGSLHEKKRPVQPGDWLEKFPEGGQSFADYVISRDEKPLCDTFSTIYVLPLGDFDETQQRIVVQTAEFLKLYFSTDVKILEASPLEDLPNDVRRTWNDTEQVLATWLNRERLKPKRPDDAIALIGLVTCDLWVEDLNYVFGSASPQDRVGVWSLFRNGDPHQRDDGYRVCLQRTIKTAAHEIGHMLGIPHCRQYECCMNGSRSREESDRRPMECCPECQPKIWWSCGADPVKRSQALAEFTTQTGMLDDAGFFNRQSDRLKSSAESAAKE